MLTYHRIITGYGPTIWAHNAELYTANLIIENYSGVSYNNASYYCVFAP
jgi:uncharacterized protein YfaP (DUF2135 family)